MNIKDQAQQSYVAWEENRKITIKQKQLEAFKKLIDKFGGICEDPDCDLITDYPMDIGGCAFAMQTEHGTFVREDMSVIGKDYLKLIVAVRMKPESTINWMHFTYITELGKFFIDHPDAVPATLDEWYTHIRKIESKQNES